MHLIFSSMSIELYIFIMGICVFCAIYSLVDAIRKKSKNPMIYVLPFVIFVAVSSAVYRYSIDLTTNIIFQEISDLIATISCILFAISFVIAFIFAYRRNYVDKKGLKKNRPIIIACLIIMLICGLIPLVL